MNFKNNFFALRNIVIIIALIFSLRAVAVLPTRIQYQYQSQGALCLEMSNLMSIFQC